MQTAYDLSGGVAKLAMTQFTTDEFFEFWPQLETMLDRVPHTWRHWTKEHICQVVSSDLIQVWGIGPPPLATLIMFTSVNVYPTMRVLTVMWAAGKFDNGMIPLVDTTLDGYARLNGCEEIEVRGRMGWESKLKVVGFKREALVWTRHVSRVNLN